MTAPATASVGRPLTKQDLKNLEKSWITAELAKAAGLRRVDRVEGARLLGQKEARDCAGIYFPYVWPGEEWASYYRVRRDHPDVEYDGEKKKEKAKYLGPPQSLNRFYMPPVERSLLDETKLPIIITEGEKKTLALHRLALHEREEDLGPRWLAIGIGGVWNWRGVIGKVTTADGGRADEKGPIPDFDRLEWEGRTVYIAYDADLVVKPMVARARWDLARHLARRLKARVRYLEIPPDAGMKAIDDLIVAWGPERVLALIATAPAADVLYEVRTIIEAAKTIKDPQLVLSEDSVRLFAQLTPLQAADAYNLLKRSFNGGLNLQDFRRAVNAEREEWSRRTEKDEVQPPPYNGKPYQANEYGLWHQRRTMDGRVPMRLTNFAAEIVSDVLRDDGEAQARAMRLRAQLGDTTRDITITAAELQKMDWPVEHLGALAIVYPNQKEHARAAIQSLSSPAIKPHHVYQHTGWALMEGQWVYLHAGGGIGVNGLAADIEVEFEGKLKFFHLPAPPEGADLVEAVDASFGLLDLAEDRLMIPLFSAIWRVALGAVNTSIFIQGQTQAGKTQLAALIQQFWGRDIDANNLPCSWMDTANALEAKLHFLKDAVAVVDDFCPAGSTADVQRLHALADRIIRAQGNKSGRSRMTSDIRMRASKFPRGLILATGEDTPKGHSLRARMVILEVGPEDIDFKRLTLCQEAARRGVYSQALSGYIQWVAGQMDDLEERLAAELAEFRQIRRFQLASRRAPDNLAQLAIGFRMFLKFCRDRAGMTKTRADHLWERAQQAFGDVLRRQDLQQAASEPCTRFLQLTVDALTSGRAHVAHVDGGPPEKDRLRWGWRDELIGDRLVQRPAGECIGWIDGEDLFLNPNTSIAVAMRLARETGDPILVSPEALRHRLKDRQLLQSTEGDRVTTRRTILGQPRVRVMHFLAGVLSPRKRSGTSGTQPEVLDCEWDGDRALREDRAPNRALPSDSEQSTCEKSARSARSLTGRDGGGIWSDDSVPGEPQRSGTNPGTQPGTIKEEQEEEACF